MSDYRREEMTDAEHDEYVARQSLPLPAPAAQAEAGAVVAGICSICGRPKDYYSANPNEGVCGCSKFAAAEPAAGEEPDYDESLLGNWLRTLLASDACKVIEHMGHPAYCKLAEIVQEMDRRADELARLQEREEKLRDACARAGMGILETSGQWSLHDVSPRAKEIDRQTVKIINEHCELEARLQQIEGIAERMSQAIVGGFGMGHTIRMQYEERDRREYWDGQTAWLSDEMTAAHSEFAAYREQHPPTEHKG